MPGVVSPSVPPPWGVFVVPGCGHDGCNRDSGHGLDVHVVVVGVQSRHTHARARVHVHTHVLAVDAAVPGSERAARRVSRHGEKLSPWIPPFALVSFAGFGCRSTSS